MKITAWDIEASNLGADFGVVLCVGFKDIGSGRPEVLSIHDYDIDDIIAAEKALLKDVSKRLLESDVWLTHYGTWYDIPFINTRLLYHRLPILPPNFSHIDTWKVSRNRLKMRNNRLVTLQDLLKLENEKNAIKAEQWIRAIAGHEPSMRYIVDHCRRDVLVLAEVYDRIKGLVLDHPNKGLVDGRGGCGVCGEKRLQARGYHLTRTRKYQRFQCQSCGAWSKSVKPIEILR